MNWEAIGAAAELLGAVGVIATLAYLAVQIRHSSDQLAKNTQSNELQAVDAIVSNYNDWRKSIVENEDVADIYIRGLTELQSLTRSERLRFNQLLSTFIWICHQYRNWQKEELVCSANVHLFGHIMRYSGGREWYRNHRDYLPEDLSTILDEVLEEIVTSGVPDLALGDSSSMFAGALEQASFEDQ